MLVVNPSFLGILTGDEVLVSAPVSTASGISKPFIIPPKRLKPFLSISVTNPGKMLPMSHSLYLPFIYVGTTLEGSVKREVFPLRKSPRVSTGAL